MKRPMRSCAALLLAAVVLSTRAETEQEFGQRVRAESVAFVQGLDAAQAQACLQTNDAATRWKMQYTGGRREGVRIGNLSASSRERLEAIARSLLSEQGWKQAVAVAAQDGAEGLGKYYVALFGDPRQGDFALRIAEHHLTLIHLEVADGDVVELGPILLGSDPPVLWQDEEQALLRLWKALGPDAPGLLLPGRGIASEAPAGAEDRGLQVAALAPAAQRALEEVWNGRLAFFAEPVRARIARLVAARGGMSALKMAFYNDSAEQRCVDGGRWDWKLSGEGVLMDFETSRKHIHMSLWIRP